MSKPRCLNCNKHRLSFSRCGSCLARYCNVDCQESHWQFHHKLCSGVKLYEYDHIRQSYRFIGPQKRGSESTEEVPAKRSKETEIEGFPEYLEYIGQTDKERLIIHQINQRITSLMEHARTLHATDIPSAIILDYDGIRATFTFQVTRLYADFNLWNEDAAPEPITFRPDEKEDYKVDLYGWEEIPKLLGGASSSSTRLNLLYSVDNAIDSLATHIERLHNDVNEVVPFFVSIFTKDWPIFAEKFRRNPNIAERSTLHIEARLKASRDDMILETVDYSSFAECTLPALKGFFNSNPAWTWKPWESE